MKSISAKIIERGILVTSSKLIPVLAQFIIMYVFAKKLSINLYGEYQGIWLFVNVLSIINLFGLPTLLLATPLQGLQAGLFSNKYRLGLFVLLFSLIPYLLFLALSNPYSLQLKLWILLLVIVQNFSILAETLAVKFQKENKLFYVTILFSVFYLTLHLFYINTNYSLNNIIIGIIILYVLKIILLFPNNKIVTLFSRADNKLNFSISNNQWLFIGVNDVIGVVFKWLDKWIILLLFNITQFAIYFNGAYEIPIFGLMLGAVGNILLVEVSKLTNHFSDKFCTLSTNANLILGMIILPAFSFLLIYHTEIFTLFFGDKYKDSIPFFVISLCIIPARCVYSAAVLQVQKRNQTIVTGALLDLFLAVVFMLILYPIYGSKGITVAFVLSTYIQTYYYLYKSGKLVQKKISDFVPFKQLFLMLVSSLVVLFLAKYFIQSTSLYIQIFIGGLICGGCIVAIFILLKSRITKSFEKEIY